MAVQPLLQCREPINVLFAILHPEIAPIKPFPNEWHLGIKRPHAHARACLASGVIRKLRAKRKPGVQLRGIALGILSVWVAEDDCRNQPGNSLARG